MEFRVASANTASCELNSGSQQGEPQSSLLHKRNMFVHVALTLLATSVAIHRGCAGGSCRVLNENVIIVIAEHLVEAVQGSESGPMAWWEHR